MGRFIKHLVNKFTDSNTFIYEPLSIEDSYSKFEGSKLVKFDQRDCHRGYYQVPKGVTEIGSHAFYGTKNLRFVELGEDVKIINNYAFMRNNLMGISMPGVEYIGESAFLGCENLEIVGLHPSLKIISRRAFENCTSLNKITLPQNLKVIDEKAFAGCGNLDKVVINCEHCKTHETAFAGTGVQYAYKKLVKVQKSEQKSV